MHKLYTLLIYNINNNINNIIYKYSICLCVHGIGRVRVV